MPQLDFTVAFPQIFWLVVIFFIIYTSMLHFFLPKFIKLVKTRKEVILFNEKEVILLKSSFTKKQSLIFKVVQRNFVLLRNIFEKELSIFLLKTSTIDLENVNRKSAKMLYNNTLYYNVTVLNLISLKLNIKI